MNRNRLSIIRRLFKDSLTLLSLEIIRSSFVSGDKVIICTVLSYSSIKISYNSSIDVTDQSRHTISKGDFMTEILPLYDKKCTCLMCEKKFTTKKVRSRFVKVKKYDTDFCPEYESTEANPMLYGVKVCPHCGFSFTKEFSSYFLPGTREEIEEKVCRNWKPQDFGKKRTMNEAINTYVLGAFCGTLKKEKHITIAGMYMRLAWLYRSLENEEQELRFSKLALTEYKESYSTADFQGTQMSEVRLLYILGELARRTHSYKESIQFFSKVVDKKNKTIELSIVEMARDRWYEVRELMKQSGE